jgi:hypothetical protein
MKAAYPTYVYALITFHIVFFFFTKYSFHTDDPVYMHAHSFQCTKHAP